MEIHHLSTGRKTILVRCQYYLKWSTDSMQSLSNSNNLSCRNKKDDPQINMQLQWALKGQNNPLRLQLNDKRTKLNDLYFLCFYILNLQDLSIYCNQAWSEKARQRSWRFLIIKTPNLPIDKWVTENSVSQDKLLYIASKLLYSTGY